MADEKVKVEKQEETVSKERYESLYNQALELDLRYKRLFEAYNKLLELYLTVK